MACIDCLHVRYRLYFGSRDLRNKIQVPIPGGKQTNNRAHLLGAIEGIKVWLQISHSHEHHSHPTDLQSNQSRHTNLCTHLQSVYGLCFICCLFAYHFARIVTLCCRSMEFETCKDGKNSAGVEIWGNC